MPGLPENIKLPSKVLDKLKTLDHELQEEDITIKGYCKRKWALLEKYLTKDISTNVTKIQNAIAQKNMDEKEGYLKIQDILQIKNIAISEKQTSQKKQILKSTENIPKPSCSYQSDDTQKLLKSKPLPQKLVPCNINKRINNNIENISNKKMKNTAEISKPNNVHISIPQINLKPKRCFTCKQDLRTIKFYNGHPNNAVDEFIALTDPKLMLFTGEENEIHSFDERPHNKITNFNIYDKDGHLCPFDSGLIEKNILLYFSGYIKPIYDENPSCDNGIPAKDLGPINEWWISGFDGGEKALIGFSTEYCEYYLMQPHKNYQPLMKSIEEKMYISKIIIEFLLNNSYLNPSYEDLLNYLQNTSLPEYISQITEETLLKHAQFICDQVNSYDSTADEDEILLITIACMRALVKLAGVTFVERQDVRQFEREEKTTVKIKKKRKAEYYVFTKATTTSLVREVFETYFPEQIDKNKEGVAVKTGCGFCATCHLPDCGKCTNCRKRKRLGSKGPNKETCKNRRCPNIAIQAASDSENDDFEFEPSPFYQQPLRSKKLLHSVTWGTPPVAQHSNKTYYNSALIGDKINIKSGDFVFLNTENSNSPSLIAKVVNMYEDNSGNKMFHANLFCRGVDTILGETTDPKEIFLLNECDVCPLGTIVSKTEVEYLKPDPNWRFNTGKLITSNNKTYFYQKQYDKKFARFENIVEEEILTVLNYNLCAICQKNLKQKQLNTPIIKDNTIYWKNEYYKTGTAVFLHPNTFKFKNIINSPKTPEPNIVDEDIYPEFYRKKSEKPENNEYCEPFCVGYIQNILENSDEIQIKVQKLYRPENTHKGIILSQQLDLNIIFWSDEQEIVSFEKVIGKCYIAFADILDIPVDEWSKQGPNRFYFTQKYDINTQEFSPVGENASFIGKSRKNKSSTKSKNKNTNLVEEPNVWLKLEQPLRTMDVFAGCGGLSEGLHQSGVANTKWAIEKEKPAANAFKLNNPNAIVYTQDCNHLLNLAISGKSQTEDSKPIPRPGDVELLVGGPPCQGFSGMNRFNAGQYSLFKNSLIVSFLSYCDFYRPKYFILENVRNFAVFKKGIILKLTLRCLLAMGYQCTFGILQAGNYGVPQIRRRLIILAAAPGETLPKYPEPIHIMDKKGRATQLDIVLDNCRYSTELKWLPLGAPYRTITVRDAMSDLPSIPNGYQTNETSYDSEPLSHFQRLMRGLDDLILRDHICKEMASIVEARMAYIPLASGSDWRDLPNIVIKLSDGTYTNKLIYEYDDKKNGKNSKGGLRGVCPCAEKKVCDPSERQFNTLIPWCLPHTANRHNQWAGLYGRLEWDGVFATTVTNPEPMGHQGRVLHPVQHRVVSVRECARSQGFPDKYRFYGNILDKYKQIGNAVPPPMGAAIGREILNAILINKH